MILRMQESKSKRGGVREGAGAKKKSEPAKPRTVHLTDKQAETLKTAGGNPYLREHLDNLGKLLRK
jgi:hypothetical protein